MKNVVIRLWLSVVYFTNIYSIHDAFCCGRCRRPPMASCPHGPSMIRYDLPIEDDVATSFLCCYYIKVMRYTYSHFSFSIPVLETAKNGSQRKKEINNPFVQKVPAAVICWCRGSRTQRILRCWDCVYSPAMRDGLSQEYGPNERQKEVCICNVHRIENKAGESRDQGGGGHGEIVKGVFKMKKEPLPRK